MIVVGCLALAVFPLIGLTIGGLADGRDGAALGAGIGFALALALCGMGSAALWKARRTR